MKFHDSRCCLAIILSAFIGFHSLSLSLMPTGNFSVAFWSLCEFQKFWSQNMKAMVKDNKSISQLPTL